jgi:hypothetical protein
VAGLITVHGSTSRSAVLTFVHLFAVVLCIGAAPFPARANEQETFGPLVLLNGGYSTALLIHNKTIDSAITVHPYVVVAGEEITLDDVALGPKTTATVALTSALRQKGVLLPKAASVILRYSFKFPGAIDGVADITRDHFPGSVTLRLLHRTQVRGLVDEAILPAGTAAGDSLLAMQNTSNGPRRVTIRLSSPTRNDNITDVTLAAHEVRTLDLARALAAVKMPESDELAGIVVTKDGAPGDVVIAGVAFDPVSRHAQRFNFTDLAHSEHHRVLRAQFVLLGAQNSDFELPANASFASFLTLRNTSDNVVSVRPLLKRVIDGNTAVTELRPFTLQPQEVRRIDLADEQRQGRIPADFRIGTIEVPYSGPPGHVLGELAGFDTAGSGVTIDSWMTTHESEAIAGMGWTVAGDAQTLLSLTNCNQFPDVFTINFYANDALVYGMKVSLAGGSIALLNLRQLVRQHVADDAGRYLPAATGTFDVHGSVGSRSSLRLERLTLNGSVDDQIVTPFMLPDGDVRVAGINSSSDASSDSSSFPPPQTTVTASLTTTAVWTDNGHTDETDWTDYSSNGSSLVVQQPPGPTVTVSMDVDSPGDGGSVIARFIDPCDIQASFVATIAFGLPRTAYVYDHEDFPFCFWRPTCTNLCTDSPYYVSIIASDATECFDPPASYVQCVGLSINGRCVIHQAVCTHQASPGYCSP